MLGVGLVVEFYEYLVPNFLQILQDALVWKYLFEIYSSFPRVQKSTEDGEKEACVIPCVVNWTLLLEL